MFITITRITEIIPIFVGGTPTRQTVLNWLAKGAFPNARKRGIGKNSSWSVPLGDVAEYVANKPPVGDMDVSEDDRALLHTIAAQVCALDDFRFLPTSMQLRWEHVERCTREGEQP